MIELQPGTQVAKVADRNNPDLATAEFGFIMSHPSKLYYFVRYWSKPFPGILRNKANSELTLEANLIPHESVPQVMVRKTMKAILEENV